MHSLRFCFLICVTYLQVHAYPSMYEDTQLNATYSAPNIRRAPPKISPKPSTSGPGSFHGSQFDLLEENDFAPAVDAMPVWMFSTTQKEFVCTPSC